MIGISDHAVKLLEFDQIKNGVASLCLSEEGRALLFEQEVLTDSTEVREELEFEGDVRRLIETETLPALDLPPVRVALEEIDKEGSVGEGAGLASIGIFVQSTSRLRKFLLRQSSTDQLAPSERLIRFSDGIPELSDVAGRILFYLDADGSVNEDRVPELKAIRRHMQSLHNEINGLTAKYLGADREIWQADVPTERDGRTVLPLKTNFRGRVAGIVHEVSATGATVFIEPMDIVEKNNQLVEQDNRYRREVHRILKELSELVRENLPTIVTLVDLVAYFDTMHARARYALQHDCTRAGFDERRVILKGARHPLLGKQAVPLDFELGERATVMIITGANAGGKTVALKTVGLLALMNQWRMEIPVHEGSMLPIFDSVLIDIGDDQSIANSLSTFSGHMRALSTILTECTSTSLVLLDEIGSGTDPAEGSAIAMAVLDHLVEKGALVVATTHHGMIKRYAFSQPGVINASVSFDLASLSPTYQLVIGLPGESHALEIAARSQVPRPILERAQGYFERGRSDVDRAAEEIAAQRKQIGEEQDRLERLMRDIAAREKETADRESSVAERERELRNAEYGELKSYVAGSRRDLENLVRELRTGEITREKTRKVKAFIDKLENKVADEERKLSAKTAATVEGEVPILPGADVFVGKSRRRGTVLRKERGDKWLVAVNTLRLTVPSSDLEPVSKRRRASRREEGVSIVVSKEAAAERPAFELDLRGMRLEEALQAVERQLDRAVLAGMAEFSVIHGKGEGILREGVQRMLKASEVVSEFYFSPPEAGGFGKTIVKLCR